MHQNLASKQVGWVYAKKSILNVCKVTLLARVVSTWLDLFHSCVSERETALDPTKINYVGIMPDVVFFPIQARRSKICKIRRLLLLPDTTSALLMKEPSV